MMPVEPDHTYTAREYSATLVMALCIALPVVNGSGSPWLLLVAAVIVGLATYLRVLRLREIRRRELDS